MPSASTPQSLARLLELLSALPTGRSAAPSELRQALADRGYAVDTRTVQRDLRLLQQHFAIDCDERSKPHGWRWRSMTARQAVQGLSTPEALSLVLADQHLRAVLPASWSSSLDDLFAQARHALDGLAPAAPSRWAAKVRVIPNGLSQRAPRMAEPGAMSEVAEALMHDRQLDLRYRRGSDQRPASYRLHPVGLLLRGAQLYLVALLHGKLSERPRLFALHRVLAAERRPEAATLPPGVDMDAALAQGRGQFGSADAPLALQLICSAALAAVLQEAPLADDQRLQARGDGRFELHASLRASWELRWWLLGHIDEIEVLAPPSLRDELRLVLTQALARHSGR